MTTPRWGGWVRIGLAALLLVLVSVAATAWVLRPVLPADDSVEAGFARDMATHHEQAVTMAELAREGTDDPDVELLAKEIALVQQAQVGQFNGWLQAWGLPATGSAPAMSWMVMGGMSMPGMASRDDLNRLADLEGREADRLFLQLMIDHHQGGVHMAEALLEHEARPEVRRLAEVIVSSQQAEIETMRAMLEEDD